MKKLLFIFLLATAGIYAQDMATINQMVAAKTLDDVKTLSDKMVQGFQTKPYFFKIKESKRDQSEIYQNVYYFPSNVVIKNNQPTPEQKEQVISVNFFQHNEGENKDLGIQGKPIYCFKEVSGTYLDLIDFWISTFYPTFTKEQILQDYKLKEYRVSKDIKFKLVKESNTWYIRRSY